MVKKLKQFTVLQTSIKYLLNIYVDGVCKIIFIFSLCTQLIYSKGEDEGIGLVSFFELLSYQLIFQ